MNRLQGVSRTFHRYRHCLVVCSTTTATLRSNLVFLLYLALTLQQILAVLATVVLVVVVSRKLEAPLIVAHGLYHI
jgi:hypothetical protein